MARYLLPCLAEINMRKSHYSAALDSAVDRLGVRRVGRGKARYARYEIIFLGVPIAVPELLFDAGYPANYRQLPEAERFKITVRCSEFYRKIHAG